MFTCIPVYVSQESENGFHGYVRYINNSRVIYLCSIPWENTDFRQRIFKISKADFLENLQNTIRYILFSLL